MESVCALGVVSVHDAKWQKVYFRRSCMSCRVVLGILTGLLCGPLYFLVGLIGIMIFSHFVLFRIVEGAELGEN